MVMTPPAVEGCSTPKRQQHGKAWSPIVKCEVLGTTSAVVNAAAAVTQCQPHVDVAQMLASAALL